MLRDCPRPESGFSVEILREPHKRASAGAADMDTCTFPMDTCSYSWRGWSEEPGPSSPNLPPPPSAGCLSFVWTFHVLWRFSLMHRFGAGSESKRGCVLSCPACRTASMSVLQNRSRAMCFNCPAYELISPFVREQLSGKLRNMKSKGGTEMSVLAPGGSWQSPRWDEHPVSELGSSLQSPVALTPHRA